MFLLLMCCDANANIMLCVFLCCADMPYRNGKEWWLVGETLRILLLTSCVGFISRSCYVKMLVAQIIALVFLVLFLWCRPYRRSYHNCFQALLMTLPVFGMGPSRFCGIFYSERTLCFFTAMA